MQRRFMPPGGHLEERVLSALWQMERASAREIYTRVGQPKGLVYTTIAKVLDRLHAKGLVSRRKVGQAFLYQPKVEREAVEQARAGQALRRLFAHEPRPALAALVRAVESIDPALLDELERAVAAKRKSRDGS